MGPAGLVADRVPFVRLEAFLAEQRLQSIFSIFKRKQFDFGTDEIVISGKDVQFVDRSFLHGVLE